WLFELEYRYVGLPEPDLVLYLRLPPDEAEQLIGSRYHGDEGKKDIHERDDAYLRSARAAAEYCASKCGWHTVDCLRASALRSVDDIHAEVLQAVLSFLAKP
ncbi:MAG: thymidylate kinase, partial [Oscillospiraceae bacterium]|nr:thymidylate kinase [Oscillospiraceae bacterium]